MLLVLRAGRGSSGGPGSDGGGGNAVGGGRKGEDGGPGSVVFPGGLGGGGVEVGIDVSFVGVALSGVGGGGCCILTLTVLTVLDSSLSVLDAADARGVGGMFEAGHKLFEEQG